MTKWMGTYSSGMKNVQVCQQLYLHQIQEQFSHRATILYNLYRGGIKVYFTGTVPLYSLERY